MAGREIYYISGPQSARTKEERDLYMQRAAYVAKEVWLLGHGALCPHLNTYEFGDGTGLNHDHFIPVDFEFIYRSNGVIMLPGWRRSYGACAELWFALWLNIPVYFYPELPEAV